MPTGEFLRQLPADLAGGLGTCTAVTGVLIGGQMYLERVAYGTRPHRSTQNPESAPQGTATPSPARRTRLRRR